MKFLIDGSKARLAERRLQADELIAGQLLTPLTGYKKCEKVFGIDNGAFSGVKIKGLQKIIDRYREDKDNCVFVAIPDKVFDHSTTLAMWSDYHHMADGYVKAFVAQDGFDELPSNAKAVFIGGTDEFKASSDCECLVKSALADGLHVHIGRINTIDRFDRFDKMGADTCDGSGVSMYDHMLEKLYRYYLWKKPVQLDLVM